MTAERLHALFTRRPALIGMVHLGPLTGSPRFDPAAPPAREAMLRDAERLVEGGVDALIVENFGDAPFYPGAVPPRTVAQLAVLGSELRAFAGLPLGINVLRNDGLAALAVAQAADAAFVRINVLAGARVTDQGVIEGQAHAILRERKAAGAESIGIVADVAVKHSRPLGAWPSSPDEARAELVAEAEELVHRAGADALVVTGRATGSAAAVSELETVASAIGDTPVLVGSGVDLDNVAALLPHAAGLIVGTSLKEGGRPDGPVEKERVTRLVRRVRAISGV